jgi:hypothetical protein
MLYIHYLYSQHPNLKTQSKNYIHFLDCFQDIAQVIHLAFIYIDITRH